MINNDRIVPVAATSLIDLYSVILAASSVSAAKLSAAAPGEFAIATASGKDRKSVV